MHKLTLTSLRKNTSRTIVTIIGIMLSIALITVVASMMTSVQQTIINNSVRFNGDYDMMVSGQFPKAFFQKLDSEQNVRNYFFSRPIGIADFEDSLSDFTNVVTIQGFDKATYDSGFEFEIKEGRLPAKSDEVLLSPSFVKLSSKVYHAGDKITFSIGFPEFVPDPSDPTGENGISKFNVQSTVTYTISGILSNAYSNILNTGIGGAPVFAYVDDEDKYNHVSMNIMDAVFIRFTDSAEKNYRTEFANLIGVEPELIVKYYDTNDSRVIQKLMDQIIPQAHKSGNNISEFNRNTEVLKAKNIEPDGERTVIMLLLACFLFVIIIGASVFIIRNSFAITITEKTKLYGMLASMGATSKQIRSNVFFEGFLLGLAGIPLGIALGVGTAAGLVAICNGLLGEFLGGSELALSVPFIVIIGAVFLGAVTIFFSVYDAAVRASKISPIVAIQSSEDINISKRGKNKEKSYRTPEFISGLFGAGGIIAWKNMKRSRKQYRATVVSIVLSVAMFITMNSFMEYNVKYIRDNFETSPYNMGVSANISNEDQEKTSIREYENVYSKVAALSAVEKYIYSITPYFNSSVINIPLSAVTDEMKNSAAANVHTDKDVFSADFSIHAVNDEFFAELAQKSGKTLEECRGKALIKNNIRVYENEGVVSSMRASDIDNSSDKVNFRLVDLLKKDETPTVLCDIEMYDDYVYGSEEGISEDEFKRMQDERKMTLSLNIAGCFYDDVYMNESGFRDSCLCVYMRLDDYDALLANKKEYIDTDAKMSLRVTDPEKFEKELSDLKNELSKVDFYINDRISVARAANMILVIAEIFAYGFIIVISLIGLTNIFNTITTNMRMRRKEFAVLQSIGMTKKEFNRMIALESLLYTVKSLIIGIPIGLLGSWAVYSIYGSRMRSSTISMPFIIPIYGILISIFAVLILVWVIMRFSIRKVRTQNIIETIRSEN